MPPYALTVASAVLLAVGAVCVVMSRSAARRDGVAPIKPDFLKFVGEQDGPRERRLKDALVPFFQGDGVVRSAYLAILETGEGRSVGLCLKADPLPDESYPGRIAELFVRVMGPGGSLDVLFLQGDQETELARVCRPFYQAAQGPV